MLVLNLDSVPYRKDAPPHQTCDIYYDATDTFRPKPILFFVGGGGWQQMSHTSDHVNDHATLAREWVGADYVVVVLRHRPVRMCVIWITALICAPLLLLPGALFRVAAAALSGVERETLHLG